jgi:hypothetical protein
MTADLRPLEECVGAPECGHLTLQERDMLRDEIRPVCDSPNCDGCRLYRIEARITAIEQTMMRTETMVQEFIGAVKPVVDDLIPMVTQLADNPMLRTLIGRKKGK